MPPGNWSLNTLESEGNLGPNRMIQEDLALPVIIDPGVDSANPEVLDWRVVSTTQPNKATFHINHSDVTNVRVGVLRASDFPLDTPFVLAEDLPIVIIDSLDKYWAGDKSAMSVSAVNGMKLFFGKAKCAICHNGPVFTDSGF